MTTHALRSAARALPIIALAAAFAATAPASASASTLLHWWQADGNTIDSVGASNGSLVGGATFGAGRSDTDGAFLIGGNAYVSVPPGPSFYQDGSFTVDAWIKTTVTTGLGQVAVMDECPGASAVTSCTNALSTWQLSVKDGKAYGYLRDSDAGGFSSTAGGQPLVSATGAPVIADGAWHHIALIKDLEAGRVSLYADGIVVAEQDLLAGVSGAFLDSDAESDPITIGTQLSGATSFPTNNFSGSIDDVRFFTGAEYPDKTPPVLSVQVLGELGPNGWYTRDVTTVRWTTKDESVIRKSTGCSDTNLTTDTAGTVITCTATSAGGTSTQSVTVKRDATGPTVTCDQVSPYYAVAEKDTMTGTATDGMSGVSTSTISKAIDTQTRGAHSVVLSLQDAVGNPGSVACPYVVVVPIVKKVTLATVATAPGPKACVKGRKVGLRVKAGLKPQVAKAQFAVAGRTIKTVTGAALAKPISLTKLPSKGRYRVTVTLTDVKANKRVASRIYKACAVKKSKAKKKKKK